MNDLVSAQLCRVVIVTVHSLMAELVTGGMMGAKASATLCDAHSGLCDEFDGDGQDRDTRSKSKRRAGMIQTWWLQRRSRGGARGALIDKTRVLAASVSERMAVSPPAACRVVLSKVRRENRRFGSSDFRTCPSLRAALSELRCTSRVKARRQARHRCSTAIFPSSQHQPPSALYLMYQS